MRGSIRSIRFQAPAVPVEATAEISPAPDIVEYGMLCADVDTLQAQLVHLPAAVDDYHGTLRVALSAARRIEERLKRLATEALDGKARAARV